MQRLGYLAINKRTVGFLAFYLRTGSSYRPGCPSVVPVVRLFLLPHRCEFFFQKYIFKVGVAAKLRVGNPTPGKGRRKSLEVRQTFCIQKRVLSTMNNKEESSAICAAKRATINSGAMNSAVLNNKQ